MTESKKEKSCLVTQNLISSINWCMSAPNSVIKPEKGGDGQMTWKQKAYDDLHNIVNRVKTPFPEPARQGVEFEKQVYKCASSVTMKGSKNFQEVVNAVKGYEFYQKGGLTKLIGGHQCYLYAKYDAIRKGDKLIDIKTTASYKPGKYLNGFQHKLYCYIADIDWFKYVIAEWDKYPKIKDVYEEVFEVTDKEMLEKEIEYTIMDAFELLKDLNLWDAYRETYCLY